MVNPQQPGCKYPNKNACGGLLVYKVCQVIDDYMDTDYSEQYDDLPGFALLADMMSMTEMENRYYAKKSLTELKHVGIKELFKGMNYDLSNLSSTDFLFGVSPAITAATRADNISLAIDLLMCDEQCSEISGLVKQLIKTNEERKSIQAEALNRLKRLVDDSGKVIIAYDPDIGRGYNGLVSQELSKHFNRPAIVLGDGEESNTYAGSFRGLEDFSMLDLLNSCENVLFAAGHDAAGGVKVESSNLQALQQELNEKLTDFKPDNTLYYDLEFNINEINERLINQINDFYRVSGYGFKPGKFLIKGLFVEDKKLMGKSANTVKIDCGILKLMKFKTDEKFYNAVPIFSEIEVIGTLNINEWKQFKPRFKIITTNQVFIEDYREVN
ncbi:putative SPBc2 prophage-derived single-strand DNA-specific exonuclease YorK [compost metagenome]